MTMSAMILSAMTITKLIITTTAIPETMNDRSMDLVLICVDLILADSMITSSCHFDFLLSFNLSISQTAPIDHPFTLSPQTEMHNTLMRDIQIEVQILLLRNNAFPSHFISLTPFPAPPLCLLDSSFRLSPPSRILLPSCPKVEGIAFNPFLVWLSPDRDARLPHPSHSLRACPLRSSTGPLLRRSTPSLTPGAMGED
jgi:hypothetical protein